MTLIESKHESEQYRKGQLILQSFTSNIMWALILFICVALVIGFLPWILGWV